MRDLLIIDNKGHVIDKSNVYRVSLTGNSTVTFTSSAATTVALNQGGQVLTWNGSGMQWASLGATAASSTSSTYSFTYDPSSSTYITPKWIAAPGGVFYKDQIEDKVKYQPTIVGRFSDK